MITSSNTIQPISLMTLISLSSLVVHFTVPEYNALFSGWKKLAEKNYSLVDSSIPLVQIEIER